MIFKYDKFLESKFNGSEKDWNKILGDIEMCFLDFTDNGWYWSTEFFGTSISNWAYPGFSCILKEDNLYNDKMDNVIHRNMIHINGEVNDGKITILNNIDKTNSEESKDFMVAVNRLNDEIGVDFYFAFNTAGGEKRILIQSL